MKHNKWILMRLHIKLPKGYERVWLLNLPHGNCSTRSPVSPFLPNSYESKEQNTNPKDENSDHLIFLCVQHCITKVDLGRHPSKSHKGLPGTVPETTVSHEHTWGLCTSPLMHAARASTAAVTRILCTPGCSWRLPCKSILYWWTK